MKNNIFTTLTIYTVLGFLAGFLDKLIFPNNSDFDFYSDTLIVFFIILAIHTYLKEEYNKK